MFVTGFIVGVCFVLLSGFALVKYEEHKARKQLEECVSKEVDKK